MNKKTRIAVAKELLKIAAEASGIEEFDRIDQMNFGQLVDYIRKHKSDYTMMPNSARMNKFKDRVDMTKPLRSMTVKEMLRIIAKLAVDLEDEENEE